MLEAPLPLNKGEAPARRKSWRLVSMRVSRLALELTAADNLFLHSEFLA